MISNFHVFVIATFGHALIEANELIYITTKRYLKSKLRFSTKIDENEEGIGNEALHRKI